MTWALVGITVAALGVIATMAGVVIRAQSAARRASELHVASVSARDAIWERLSHEVAARTELAQSNAELGRRIEELSAEYEQHRAASSALIEQSYGRFLERLSSDRATGNPSDGALASYVELLQARLSGGDRDDTGGQAGRAASAPLSRDTPSADRRKSD